MSPLRAVLVSALEWNRTAKTDIVKYDLEPFAIPPLSPWNPDQMESFERLSRTVERNRPIISPISFGLNGSVALGGRRVTYVQQKAHVLVEEWFRDGPGIESRNSSGLSSTSTFLNSTYASSSTTSPSTVVSMHPSNNRPSNQHPGIVSKQVGPTLSMSAAVPPQGRNVQQATTPAQKGGRVCC